MAHLFVACPACGAAYKIAKEHAATEAVCRACGHRWVPAESPAAPPKAEGGAEASSAEEGGVAAGPKAAEAEKPKPSPAEPPRTKPPTGAATAGSGKAAEPQKPASPDRIAAPVSALEAMARAAKGEKPTRPRGRAGPRPSRKGPPSAKGPRGEQAKAPPRKGGPKPGVAPTDSLIGTRINGFKIQARIGTGGFGVVYRAFDTNLERSVAIKMLPPNIAEAGKGVVERFLREARSAAKLAHPNIVTIHQICAYKNTYYIVMELVEGGALHEYLARKGRLRPEEATRIVRAAAEGLGHAHKRGIIHRDIKPGNIMLTNDGQVKVSDFGLARDVLQGRDIVGSGHSLGTPRYMAPEQALGEEPSAASDLYSLAATYYMLLTGRAPFDGMSDREIMKKQVQASLPDPRRHVSTLPVTAYRFFERAMAKEPGDRYPTAERFIQALDRLDFSRGGEEVPESKDLAEQIGSVAVEDRGSHLSETLGRAVRRAQRQRTPLPESAVEDFLSVGTAAVGRKVGWKLWVIIGVAVLAVLGGAVAAAILLGPGAAEPPRKRPGEEVKAPGEEAKAPAPETTGEVEPAGPPTTGEAPTTETQPPQEPPESPLEDVARERLAEVRAYEADPDIPVYELIRMYQEIVIQTYPGTEAAKEARKVVERLRTGKRLEGPGPSAEEAGETPAEESGGEAAPPPGDEESAKTPPTDEKPAQEKPDE